MKDENNHNNDDMNNNKHQKSLFVYIQTSIGDMSGMGGMGME